MRKEAVVGATVVTAAAAVVGVVVLVRHWKRRSERRWRAAQRILRKLANDSATPVAKLWQVAGELGPAGGDEENSSSLCKLVSNLAAPLPTGEEKGTFYGINLRGSEVVILRARLEGKNESVSEMRRQELQIPSSVLAKSASSTKELCDFLGLELAKFISLQGESDGDKSSRGIKLGFTISYPTDQTPPPDIIWNTLPFDDTVVGKEFGNEINEALEKHGLDMRVFAVVKDTIGHLGGGQYYNKESVAAVSLGTGTDVAYIESPTHPAKSSVQTTTTQVFNMQWGNFSSTHLPLTEYDVALDAESTNPRDMVFEKLISGMCMGEIVRRVLLKMAQEAALFGDSVPPKLAIPYILRPFDMAAMHQDTSEVYEIVDEKLKQIFEINNTTPMVREIVVEVCDVVTERGARLIGAGIVGIMKKLDRIKSRKSAVTVEGGLYEHYRIFRNYLHSSVWEMLGSDLSDNVVIEHCHGGSAAGSIFLAASQSRDAKI